MDIEPDAIVVFTARSPNRIIREGGSQAWVLNPVRAKLCKWLVCTQNRHNKNHEFSDATEPHGSAFMIAKISGIISAVDDPQNWRWKIAISEFALIDIPNIWDHWRNPVRYMTLDELGIDPDKLNFRDMPPSSPTTPSPSPLISPSAVSSPGMTIEDAKKGLALAFGVKPDAVEITIRG